MKSFSGFSQTPSSNFNGCITNICTEQRDKKPSVVSVSVPILKLMRASSLHPPTLFDSHSYKVKGRQTYLSFILFSFAQPLFLSSGCSEDYMCGDLTPIFSWLWNPGRLNYEHNSTTFFLRFILRYQRTNTLPSLLVQ